VHLSIFIVEQNLVEIGAVAAAMQAAGRLGMNAHDAP